MPADTMGSVRFPAFLSVFLYTTVMLVADVVKTNMFPKAVNYPFKDCRDDMLQMVTKPGGLLQTELENNPHFKSIWKKDAACNIPMGMPEHRSALQSYIDADHTFENEKINKLIHSKDGDNTSYFNEFPFKSLYLLLIDAMQLSSDYNCRTVYSGTKKKYSTKHREKVHFGFFSPVQLKFSDATELAMGEDGTVFNITSCFVVNLDELTCDSENMDMLISPTEVFEVQDIGAVNNNNDKYTMVSLKHESFHDKPICQFLSSFSTPPPTPDKSSFNLLSSSLMNLMAPFVMVYFYTLAL